MRALLPILPLLLATPAGAQIWDGGHTAERPAPVRSRVDWKDDGGDIQRGREARRIDRSIRDGVRRGELSRREARELRAMASAVGRPTGVASGIGTQQTTALLNLRGMVDARRWEGRQRLEAGAAGRKP